MLLCRFQFRAARQHDATNRFGRLLQRPEVLDVRRDLLLKVGVEGLAAGSVLHFRRKFPNGA